MLVLICGSRLWKPREIRGALRARMSQLPKDTAVVTGGAGGADVVADQVASELGLDRLIVPANYTRHGKAAGPIRNRVMLDMKPDLVIGYPYPGQGQNAWTYDTIIEAVRRGIEAETWQMDTKLQFNLKRLENSPRSRPN